MAQIPPKKPRGKAARYAVPVTVAGVAAATIGLVPAFAGTGSPDLPKITAKQLVAKMAASHTKHMSGTVKVSTDLGLPAMPGSGGGGGGQGGLFGGGPHGEGKPGADGSAGKGGDDGGGADKGSSAAPQNKLMELASGEHTLRVAADGPDKQRVSVVEDAAEYTFVHNGDEVWAYDSGTNAAYHATAPKGAAAHKGERDHGPDKGLAKATPQEAAEQALKAVDDSTSVSVDGTEKIAGRDAYQLVIEPKKAAYSTVGSIRIAVDAANGAPLKFTLNPKDGGKPVVDAAYTQVDFGKPSAGTFRFKAPKGADVTEHKAGAKADGKAGHEEWKRAHKQWDGKKAGLSGLNTLGEGWGTVVELKAPKGALSGKGAEGRDQGRDQGQGMNAPQAKQLLDSFTEKAKGDFGTGRVFSTRLVNALITDDGKIYAGAVTKEGLIKAADEAAAK